MHSTQEMRALAKDYRPSLWDESEPEYAPGLSKSKDKYYWRPTKAMVNSGYNKSAHALREKTSVERALTCRALTREYFQWLVHAPQIQPETWAWLIRRFETDEYSPFQNVKYVTQKFYRNLDATWIDFVGHIEISTTGYEELMRWHNKISEKRSPQFASRMMNHLRMVTGYGVRLQHAPARTVKEILSEMRFKGGKPRSQYISRDQFNTMVRAALDANLFHCALGWTIQFELAMSASDVIGNWSPVQKDGAPFDRNGKYWTDGITWGDIAPDLSTITKGRNKTDQEPIPYDISHIVDLQNLLLSIPQEDRIGPLIKTSTGLPPKETSWSRQWRRLADKNGLEGYQCRDLRAGGITEAKILGVPIEQLRDVARHTTSATTQRYARAQESTVNKVIQLRQASKK